jgi:hypothetical protein
MAGEKSKVDAADPAADDTVFCFGVTALRAAERRREARETRLARAAEELALVEDVKRRRNWGFDPYNSGSIDQDNAWQRIAKRS